MCFTCGSMILLIECAFIQLYEAPMSMCALHWVSAMETGNVASLIRAKVTASMYFI